MKTFLIILVIFLVIYLIVGYFIAEAIRKDSTCTLSVNTDGTGTSGPCPNIKVKDMFIWPMVFFAT